MKKQLLSLAFMLLTIVGFTSHAVAQDAPTLTETWKITAGLPAVSDARQMIAMNGKFYIQNRVTQKVEVWDQNGKIKTELASGTGSNITKDQAGNIIVLINAFPNNFTGGAATLRVFPADGGTHVDIALKNIPGGRCDFFGIVQGNVLDATEGGRMYVCSQNVSSVTVIPIVGGVQDVDMTVSMPISFAPDNMTIVQAISDNEAVITKRSSGTPPITKLTFDFGAETVSESMKFVTPGRHSIVGSHFFTMGGVDYLLYKTSGPGAVAYKDGFAIAKATDAADNKKIVELVETASLPANGTSQSSWTFVDVVSDYKANIYHYFAGSYIAMYEFALPEPPKPKLYMIGANAGTNYTWAANVGHEMTMGEPGVYTTSVRIAESEALNGTPSFAFATQLGADANDWDTLNANRFGATTDGDLIANDTETTLVKGDAAFKIAGWTYDVTVDMNKMTVKCVANPPIPAPEPDKLFMIGSNAGTNYTWVANAGHEMTMGEPGVYTTSVRIAESETIDGTPSFAFATKLGADANDWDGLKANRIGATTNGDLIANNTETTLVKGEGAFKIAGWTYDVTVDLNKMTVKCVANPPIPEPEKLYIIGKTKETGYVWGANVGHEMTSTEAGIYTTSVRIAESDAVEGNGFFGFTTKLGIDDKDWDTLNANRYGAQADGTLVENDTEVALVKGVDAFKIVGWTYDVTVDMNKKTVKCVANPPIPVPDPEPTEPELKRLWKIAEGMPAAAESRQMTAMNGKIYIQHKANKNIEIWSKDGKATETISTGEGSNITHDDAGNIIVRIGKFSYAIANGTAEFRIIPADGSAAVDVTLTDIPAGRFDWFGHVRGNVLDTETGGTMYLGITDQAGVFVLPIIDGVQDAENSYLAGVPGLIPSSGCVVNPFGENGLAINVRSAGNTIIKAELEGETINDLGRYVTPDHYASVGHSYFTMGGVDYIVYPTSTNKEYRDGFAIAKASTDAANPIVVKFDPEWTAAVANGFQGNWVIAEVVSDTKTNIYQYYPGGYISMYEFTAPVPVVYPEKLYAIGNVEGSSWDPSNGSIFLEQDPIVAGTYKGTIIPTDGGDLEKPNMGFFALGSVLGATADDWATFNANRFGPKVTNTELVANIDGEIAKNGDTSYAIAVPTDGNKYQLVVNLVAGTITATEISGVNDAEASTYKVIAGIGEINVIGDAKTIEVFTTGGALIESGKSTIRCVAGIYLVRVDGKTHKVIVK